MSLTPSQTLAIQTTERVASTFSLIGCAFIFISFLTSHKFRQPINRLIFYAAWGNALCNVGTLMSLAGIQAGQNSGLCQLQGFLIQLFVPADAFWNLSLAINVYLTVFKNYSVDDLKSLEWVYILVNYGGCFVPAFVYCFVTTEVRGRIYGNAVLWCWITSEWDFLRIATLYGPAWVAITVTFGIYVVAGRNIYLKRSRLRSFSQAPPKPPQLQNPFTSFKTTEINITTSELADMSPTGGCDNPSGIESQDLSVSSPAYEQYSVRIERGGPHNRMPQATVPGAQSSAMRQHKAAMEANTAAWGYTKCAILFFASLLITWVPSSANRVYSLVHPGPIFFPLAYSAGLVLPLMGFWNSVIYITTSWDAVKDLFHTVWRMIIRAEDWRQSVTANRRMGRSRALNSIDGQNKSPASLSDSMKGLAV